MKNIFKFGVAVISAIILYGCTTANAAYAPVEDNAIVTTLITETSTATSTTTTTTTTTTTVGISTETTTLEITTTAAASFAIPETTTAANDVIQTTESEVNELIVTTVSQRDYVVYKPSTHYIHKSTCHWVDATCYEIENTENIECRICSECNPDMEIINEYIPETVNSEVAGTTYVKNFSRGTYYAYGGARYGGSGRNLIDCSYGDGTVKGSIASSYLYNTYGYNYNNKRTMVYLEINGYSSMNGYYYLDDSDAGNPNVIDFFYLYGSNCQFQNQGVVSVECYIVNY